MATTPDTRQVAISLPEGLVADLDTWANEQRTTRSAVLAKLIRAESRRRADRELAEAYRDAAAEGFYDDIEVYLHAQAEVILAEPSDPEAWRHLLA